jgi:hypothetical protein
MRHRRAALAFTLAALSMGSTARAQSLDAAILPRDQSDAKSVNTPGIAPAIEVADNDRGMLSGLFFSGEFLYVYPHRDGLEIATRTSGSGGTVESLGWSGIPAFRIGIGYRLPDCGWDFCASLTYLHARDQRTLTAQEGGSLLGTLTPNPAAQSATGADGDAGLVYSMVDFDVGKSFRLDDAFGLRLFAGARLARVDESLKCIYSGGALGDSSDFVNAPVNFEGAGLSAGAAVDWNIWRGWGLYARGRLALVSGQFKSQRTETLGTTVVSNVSDSFTTTVPVEELSVGVRYQGDHFFFSAGFEQTDWFNMVDSLTNPSVATGQPPRHRGDLTLDALAVKAAFVF